jgi:glucosylceramidase
LSNVAFRNEDDGSLVLIVANSSADVRRFSVSSAKRTFSYELSGKSVATFVWSPRGY